MIVITKGVFWRKTIKKVRFAMGKITESIG